MASPPNTPADQLNTPPIDTGAVKLIVPLVKLIVSLEAGTPDGLQFPAVNQSLEIEPFQVTVAPGDDKEQIRIGRTDRRSLVLRPIRQCGGGVFLNRSVDILDFVLVLGQRKVIRHGRVS